MEPDDRLRPHLARLRSLLCVDLGQAVEGDGHREVPNRRGPADVGSWLWSSGAPGHADHVRRVDDLRHVPADVRFISAEPLLGPLPSLDLEGVDWLIAGGESGHRAHPVAASWVVDLRDACTDAEIAFFFMQWGGRTPKAGGRRRPSYKRQSGHQQAD